MKAAVAAFAAVLLHFSLLLDGVSAGPASTSRHRLTRRAGTIIIDGSSAVIDNSTNLAYAWKFNKARPALAKGLDNATLARIKQNLADHSSDSWVSGTRSEAILELDHPTLSVFSNNYFGRIAAGATPAQVTDIAKYWLDQLPADARQFVLEGAAGDTASVGVAFLNAMHDPSHAQQGEYETFADREVDWLLTTIPRMQNGALSHRPPNEQAQVWAGEHACSLESMTTFADSMFRCTRQYLHDTSSEIYQYTLLCKSKLIVAPACSSSHTMAWPSATQQ